MRVSVSTAAAATLLLALAGCAGPNSSTGADSLAGTGQAAAPSPTVTAPGPQAPGNKTDAQPSGTGGGPATAAGSALPSTSEILADFDAALVKLSGTYVPHPPEDWTGPTYPDQEEEFFAHLAALVEPEVKAGWRAEVEGDKLAAVRAWVREYPATTYDPALLTLMWEMTCVSVENAGEDSPLPAAIADADQEGAIRLAIAYTCPALQSGL